MSAAKGKGKSRIDIATIGGLVIALGGIVGGLLLEGGQVSDISQVTAAIIVLGGTIGAVMVTTPLGIFLGALKAVGSVFFEKVHSHDQIIAEILDYANKARKNGIVSLEAEVGNISDPFLQKALNLGVDGTDLAVIKHMMEVEIDTEERQGKAEAKVYEAAGGYAPTVGIIGAVMGLIQVMKHLEDIKAVGHGIAVAFVATVYGVAVSNLVFLPAAAKLKARVDASVRMKELMLEGVCGIVQGLHPSLIEHRLRAYSSQASSGKKGKGKAAAAEQSRAA